MIKYCLVYKEKHGDHRLWGERWVTLWRYEMIDHNDEDPIKTIMNKILTEQEIKRIIEPISLTVINSFNCVSNESWQNGIKIDKENLDFLNKSFDNCVE